MKDIQRAIHNMVWEGERIKVLDPCHVVNTQSVEVTCLENIYFQKNSTLNATDSFPSLKISVKTPSSFSDSSKDLLAQVVAMKKEIKEELRSKTCCLKSSDNIDIIKFYKSEISLLKDQNSFLKSELQRKQLIVQKLLNLL